MIYITGKKLLEVKKMKDVLEKKLGVRIKLFQNGVDFEGDALNEFTATTVFEAVKFGFSVRKAMLLAEEDFIFKTVHIKSHTKRSLKEAVSRLAGKEGKTRRIIESISGCFIMIKDGEVGIIGDSEEVLNVETAVVNIIKGTKQSNVYRFLERMNTLKKENLFIK